MKNALSLKIKILLLCCLLTLFGALVTGYGLYTSVTVNAKFTHVSDINLPNAESLGYMATDQKDTYLYLMNWDTQGKPAELRKKIEEKVAEYEKMDKWYQDIPFVEGEDAVYQKVAGAWSKYKEALFAKLDQKNTTTDLLALNTTFGENISALIKFQSDQAKTWSKAATEESKKASLLQICVLALLVLGSVVCSMMIGNSIAQSLLLTAKNLNESIEIVHQQAAVMNQSSQGLSQAATEQAASLEETAASLEEITAMIAKASDGADAAASSSAESYKKTEEGRAAVDQMLTSMEEISQSNAEILTQVNESNRQMGEIVNVIQEIGNKTKVINEIVFQTKLLSFNASVEAARAGEHGKGFAVVAEEVGSLAQMSGNAAKEITDLLDGSVAKVQTIVSETKSKVESLVQSGKAKVDSGVEVAHQCSALLNEIVQNVQRVSGLSQEISQANKEQATGVAEINKAMSQLDMVTQQNASSTEQVAGSANELSTQADLLKSSVHNLLVTIQGGSVQSDVLRAPPPKAKAVPTVKATNVVPFKKNPPAKTTVQEKSAFKKVAGDEFIPDRDSAGFGD